MRKFQEKQVMIDSVKSLNWKYLKTLYSYIFLVINSTISQGNKEGVIVKSGFGESQIETGIKDHFAWFKCEESCCWTMPCLSKSLLVKGRREIARTIGTPVLCNGKIDTHFQAVRKVEEKWKNI